jgi:outer membrane protein TolC
MQKENLCSLFIQCKLLLGAFCVLCSVAAQAVTLGDAIESALKFDPSLRASKFNVLAAGENIAIARSRLLPQASLQGSSNQLTQTTTQELSTGGSSSRSFTGPSVNHQFVIRQALLRPKELSALRYAELQSQYMEIKFKSDVKDLRTRVIHAWIDLLGAQQIAQAYERPLHLMQIAAKQERAKYEQGDSTKDSAMEAEAQYENSKATHIQALETLKNKQSAFENLTKIPALVLAEEKLGFDSLPLFKEADKYLLWTNFQDTSLEIQMAKLQEQMQLERLKMAEADHKPTIDLLAAVNFAQNDATSTQGYKYRNKQVGVQYSLPLFAGGGLTASTKQASLAYESSLAEGEALFARLANDFDASWAHIRANNSRQIAMLKGLASARELVNSNRRGFEMGIKSIAESANAELVFARRINEIVLNTQEYIKNALKVDPKSLMVLNF